MRKRIYRIPESVTDLAVVGYGPTACPRCHRHAPGYKRVPGVGLVCQDCWLIHRVERRPFWPRGERR